jgi:hypothetical protein
MKRQITKNQHYVPQMILRNFGKISKKNIRSNIYDIKTNSIRENQNIKKIFSRNYMYDKNNIIEDFLHKHVESPASGEIKNIIGAPLEAKFSASTDLLRFIIVQLRRTQGAYEHSQDFINSQTSTIFQETCRLNNMDEDVGKNLRLIPKVPRSQVSLQTLHAVLCWPLISDLSHHIIINKNKNVDFIISDNPIFQYNWYLRDCSDTAQTSISNKGIQLFFPLSKNIVYCLYDKSVYRYGSSKQHYTVIENEKDVEILNSFQMLNASSMVVFSSIKMKHNIAKLAKTYGKKQLFTTHSAHNKAKKDSSGKLKSLHAVWRTQTLLPSLPSFIKIKNKVRRRKVICIDRNPEIVQAVDNTLEEFKNERA